MSHPYISKLPQPPMTELLVSLRNHALQQNIPIISIEGIRFLSQVLRLQQAKTVLEIGTAIGFSSIYLATYNDVHITTIERDMNMVEQATSNIQQSGVANQIRLIHDDAIFVNPDTLGTFDVIFIDAAKAQSKNLFDKYRRCLNDRGSIVVDNILFHGLHDKEDVSRQLAAMLRKLDEFNQYVMTLSEFDTSIYPIGDGMSLSIKRM